VSSIGESKFGLPETHAYPPSSSGDATKAREKPGWEPEVNFEELMKMMVEA
jgi:GDP-D-mannose dehydratase